MHLPNMRTKLLVALETCLAVEAVWLVARFSLAVLTPEVEWLSVNHHLGRQVLLFFANDDRLVLGCCESILTSLAILLIQLLFLLLLFIWTLVLSCRS